MSKKFLVVLLTVQVLVAVVVGVAVACTPGAAMQAAMDQSAPSDGPKRPFGLSYWYDETHEVGVFMLRNSNVADAGVAIAVIPAYMLVNFHSPLE